MLLTHIVSTIVCSVLWKAGFEKIKYVECLQMGHGVVFIFQFLGVQAEALCLKFNYKHTVAWKVFTPLCFSAHFVVLYVSIKMDLIDISFTLIYTQKPIIRKQKKKIQKNQNLKL